MKNIIILLFLTAMAYTTFSQVPDQRVEFKKELDIFTSYIDSIKPKYSPLVYYVDFQPKDSCESNMTFSVKYIWNNYEKETLTAYKQVLYHKGKIILFKKDEKTPEWVVFDMMDDFYNNKIDCYLIQEGVRIDEGRLEYIYSGCVGEKRIIRVCCGARYDAPDIIIRK